MRIHAGLVLLFFWVAVAGCTTEDTLYTVCPDDTEVELSYNLNKMSEIQLTDENQMLIPLSTDDVFVENLFEPFVFQEPLTHADGYLDSHSKGYLYSKLKVTWSEAGQEVSAILGVDPKLCDAITDDNEPFSQCVTLSGGTLLEASFEETGSSSSDIDTLSIKYRTGANEVRIFSAMLYASQYKKYPASVQFSETFECNEHCVIFTPWLGGDGCYDIKCDYECPNGYSGKVEGGACDGGGINAVASGLKKTGFTCGAPTVSFTPPVAAPEIELK